MRKAGRNPGLPLVLRRKLVAHPTSKGPGRSSQIDHDVENGPGHHAHKLSLRRLYLVMQPAEHALCGPAVIILDKTGIDPRRSECARIPALQKEPAIVVEHTRFHELYA